MFHEYTDSLPHFRKLLPEATRESMYHALSGMPLDPIAFAHLDWERRWYQAKCPFYRVWPSVLPMLLALDITKVPSHHCKLPDRVRELLIQLPVGNSLGVHCIMAANCRTKDGTGIIVGSMDGKLPENFPIPLVDVWIFGHSNQTLEDNLNGLKQAAPILADTSIRDRVVSLVTTLCLIDENPELLSPVLLNADATRDAVGSELERLGAKARRRGRIGWDVGKSIEVAPHIRRPHPALMWTGEGRKVPRVVMRKGSVVHRSKIESIPTGYDTTQD